MLVVFPIISVMILVNFLQIYFFYSPGTLELLVTRAPLRFGGLFSLCLIFFLATNNYTRELFNKIETNKWLAYVLNIPFLYLLLKYV